MTSIPLTSEPESTQPKNEYFRDSGTTDIHSSDSQSCNDDDTAEEWTEESWANNVLGQDFVRSSKEKLQNRVEEFLAHATPDERAKLDDSREEMQKLLESARKEQKQRYPEHSNKDMPPSVRIKKMWNATSEAAYTYVQNLDVMVGQAPEYVALVYGAVKIILIVQVNYEEVNQKVRLYLDQIASRFEMVDHLTAYKPTKSLVTALSQAYALYTRFLVKAVKLYTQCRMVKLFKALARPWKIRFQELVNSIDQKFLEIKDIAQYHGLLTTHANLKISNETLAIVKSQQMILEDLSRFIAVRFSKETDVRQTASQIRQDVDERLDQPAKNQKANKDTAEQIPDHPLASELIGEDLGPQVLDLHRSPAASMNDLLDEVFPELKQHREEAQRRKKAIEELPNMRQYRAKERNLLRSEQFLSWLESDESQLLWVEGNNVLSRSTFNIRFITPLILVAESNFESTTVLRHFCGETGLQKRYHALLQALLFQLLEQNTAVYQQKSHLLTRERTSETEKLWELFVDCLGAVKADCIFIFIDGIDNLSLGDAADLNERSTILKNLEILLDESDKLVKALMTSGLGKSDASTSDELMLLVGSQHPRTPRQTLSLEGLSDELPLFTDRMLELQERRRKTVRFLELPLLYTPGTTIFRRSSKFVEAFVITEAHGMSQRNWGRLDALTLRVWSVSHNGKYFTKCNHEFSVNYFGGERAINDLEFVPSGYLHEEIVQRKELIERGRRYWTLGQGAYHKQIKVGRALERVVIDNSFRPNMQEHQEQFPQIAVENLKPGTLLLCPATLDVYVLRNNEWITVEVSSIQDITFKKDPFSNIVDSKDRKSLVQGLIEPFLSHRKPPNGVSILFYGNPGVGKSLMAECSAEYAQKPLLLLPIAEIEGGIDSSKRAFIRASAMAQRWGAISLVENIDFFMGGHVNNNNLRIFIQEVLEKNTGILILTFTGDVYGDRGMLLQSSWQVHATVLFEPPSKHNIDRICMLLLSDMERQAAENGETLEVEKDGIVRHIKYLKELSKDLTGLTVKQRCEIALSFARQESLQSSHGLVVLKVDHFQKISSPMIHRAGGAIR